MARYNITRREVLQLSGLGAASSIAGCLGFGGGDGDGDAEDEQIHVLTDFNNEDWQNYWEEDLVPSFEEEFGIPIELEYAGFEGVGQQRLATLMQAGDPPEFYHADLAEIGDLVNQGQTMPVTDVVDDLEDQWGDLLFKETMIPFPGGEEVHLIPHGIYTGTFYYRQDIYDELDLSVPQTWEELVENARAIDEAEHIDARGYSLPAAAPGKSSSEFGTWLYTRGGRYYRWDGDEVAIELEREHVLDVLDHMEELSQYSPDPSGTSWAETIEQWAAGRIAQCWMLNAWLAIVPYAAGAEEVGLNTRVTISPAPEGIEPFAHGGATISGTPIFEGSTNPEGAKEFKRHMYGPEWGTQTWLIEPMRMLPPYDGFMETEGYVNSEFGQLEDGFFREQNQRILDEIVPHLAQPDETVETPETLMTDAFFIDSDLVNEVIVEGRDPETAYEDAIERYESRLQEAKEESAY